MLPVMPREKLYEIAAFKNGKYDTAIKYYLVETKTLDGYTLDQTKYEGTFAYADDSTPVVEVTFNLTNEKPEVPETPSTPDVPQSHEETRYQMHRRQEITQISGCRFCFCLSLPEAWQDFISAERKSENSNPQ